jgi:hypothetical protein
MSWVWIFDRATRAELEVDAILQASRYAWMDRKMHETGRDYRQRFEDYLIGFMCAVSAPDPFAKRKAE